MPRYEKPYSGRRFEVEREGSRVHLAKLRQNPHGEWQPRRKTTEFASDDQAVYEYAKLVRRGKRVGPSQFLDHAPEPRTGSTLLLDEYFATEDARFVDELLHCNAVASLGNFANKWKSDARPWARRQLLAYVSEGCDRPGHLSLVKRLYKHAEEQLDLELLAHFMVAFDAFNRRLTITDWNQSRRVANPLHPYNLAIRHGATQVRKYEHLHFSNATRMYLARRVNRCARQLARTDVTQYQTLIQYALPLYTDTQLDGDGAVWGAWSLLHILYGKLPGMKWGAHGASPHAMALKAFSPAPAVPAAWQNAFSRTFALLLVVRATAIQHWLIDLLKAEYPQELNALDAEQLTELLLHAAEPIAVFGATLLPTQAVCKRASVEVWLQWLRVEHLDVAAVVAKTASEHLAPARLSVDHCSKLAASRCASIAQLAWDWLKDKPITSDAELTAVLRLAKASVPAVRRAAAERSVALLKQLPHATYAHVRDLCDAPTVETRTAALALARANPDDARLAGTPLWLALTESPYTDVRAEVIAHATRWRDTAPAQTRRHIWASALLAVHTGNRIKPETTQHIVARLHSHPDEADDLLPLLAVALRSVRARERATALTAIVELAQQQPALAPMLKSHFAEVTLSMQVSQ